MSAMVIQKIARKILAGSFVSHDFTRCGESSAARFTVLMNFLFVFFGGAVENLPTIYVLRFQNNLRTTL